MKNLELRLVKSLFLMILGVSVMFTLFGCGKPKYKLHFEGYGFQSSKTEYAAGDQVTVYYDLIATDTDYRFWLDDETIKLKQDYDDRHGYVFTFTMPDHELTLHVSSRNSMEYIPMVSVTFQNEVEEADVWLLPQTEENLKTSLWGTPSAGALGKGASAELTLTNPEYAEAWLVRIIDRNKAYYSAQDLKLEDGYTASEKDMHSVTEMLIRRAESSISPTYMLILLQKPKWSEELLYEMDFSDPGDLK